MRDQYYGVTAILIRTLALYHVNCRVKSLPPRHGNTCRTFYGYRCSVSRTRARRDRDRASWINYNLRLARARAFLNLHFNFALREDRWDELLSVLIFGVRTELPLIWTNARTWRQLSENVVINLFSALATSRDDIRLSSLSKTIFIKVTDVAAIECSIAYVYKNNRT